MPVNVNCKYKSFVESNCLNDNVKYKWYQSCRCKMLQGKPCEFQEKNPSPIPPKGGTGLFKPGQRSGIFNNRSKESDKISRSE